MSKIIAIFCDGTWNSPTIPEPTNVVECYEACAQSQDQVAIYVSGVGTTSVGGKIRAFVNKWGGGAFGWGLNARIQEGYEAVVDHYEPGDRIMIFGFSRGAYTARSLAGMIRKCGIMGRDKLGPFSMARAFRLYRKGGPHNAPDKPHILKARRELSPRFATSQKDLDSRKEEAHLVDISYLGVWDTVGALGIPEAYLGPVARYWNQRYEFHDTDLSSMVDSARHAVAVDERRELYLPALWGNLDKHTRSDGTESLGLNQGTTGPARPFQQLWFIGNHGVVGGSSELQGLVAISRDWVLEGARARGLQLKPDASFSLPDALQPGSPGTPLHTQNGSKLAWRPGPRVPENLHPSVKERVEGVPDYRPETVQVALADVFAETRVA